MAAERRARAVWEGTLLEGQGRLSTESTPVLSDQPVTWAGSNAIRGNVEIRLTAELQG